MQEHVYGEDGGSWGGGDGVAVAIDGGGWRECTAAAWEEGRAV